MQVSVEVAGRIHERLSERLASTERELWFEFDRDGMCPGVVQLERDVDALVRRLVRVERKLTPRQIEELYCTCTVGRCSGRC